MASPQIIGVDIGNTSIKTAEFLSDGVGDMERWRDIEEVYSRFKGAQFVICSVRKGLNEVPGSFILTHKTLLPINLKYNTPESLGMDRLAAAVGANHLFPKENVLVIDGGTCVTYDLITENGEFQGGIISPGLEMRLKAMHHFTQGLPEVTMDSTDIGAVGKSTLECMQIGAAAGLKNEIEGFLQTFNKKHPDLRVVTTGGLLPSFESGTKKPIFASSKIVLSGLRAIWKFNEGN